MLFGDVEDFFNFYVRGEVGSSRKARQNWIEKRLAPDDMFWEERND
jgi:hypothetical protein